MRRGIRRRQAGIQGEREARALAATLGAAVRAGRRRARLRQVDLGTQVGVGQSRISAVERGLGARLPLETWVAIGLALGQPIAVTLTRRYDPPGVLADAIHLDMQERVIGLLSRHGYRATFELPTRPVDPSRSADVGAVHPSARRVLVLECWNRFGDLGAAARSSARKVVEAGDHAAAVFGVRPATVHLCWLIRPTAANRAIVRRYPGALRSRFPGSSAAWARAINDGAEPPTEAGLVWLDLSLGRAVPIRWSRSPFLDQRQRSSGAPH
jgi:hypothetical protein